MKWTGICTLVLVLLSQVAVANIIENGDFETAGPAGWSIVNTSTQGTCTYQTSGGNPGAFAEITNYSGTAGWSNQRYWIQGVDVDSSTDYTLSFDYKTSDYYSFVKIDYWEGPGQTGWLGQKEVYDSLQYGNPSLAKSSEWTQKSSTFTTPGNAGFLTVKLLHNAGYSYVSFDNVSLIPEPATMVVLTAGAAGMLVRRRRA